EVVRIWRKKEPIHSIEPLLGCLAGAPRLDVTGLQQRRGGDAGKPAGPFDLLDIGAEDTLPTAGGHKALSLPILERERVSDPPLNSVFDSLNDALVAQPVQAASRQKQVVVHRV